MIEQHVKFVVFAVTLLQYGGYSVFSDDVVLAQTGGNIKLFGLFAGMNGIASSILWMIYATMNTKYETFLIYTSRSTVIYFTLK